MPPVIDDMAMVIEEIMGHGTDGYWYYPFNEISASNPDPPPLHGDLSDYWNVIDQANAMLLD